MWCIPHLIDLFQICIAKSLCIREFQPFSLPVLIGLHHIFIIIYLLATDCYILSVKIMAKSNKNDFLGWIIFYVCTVHLIQLIFLMLPLNVFLLNGIDCYSSNPYMGNKEQLSESEGLQLKFNFALDQALWPNLVAFPRKKN